MLLAVALRLGGCGIVTPQRASDEAPPSASDSLTRDEAKAITLERIDELAARFPAASTGSVQSFETARSLYPCREGNRFQWPGITRIEIIGEVDAAAFIKARLRRVDRS